MASGQWSVVSGQWRKESKKEQMGPRERVVNCGIVGFLTLTDHSEQIVHAIGPQLHEPHRCAEPRQNALQVVFDGQHQVDQATLQHLENQSNDKVSTATMHG